MIMLYLVLGLLAILIFYEYILPFLEILRDMIFAIYDFVFPGNARRKAEEAERKRVYEERQAARTMAYEDRLKRMSLTCNKCGKLASPIAMTRNRYKCPACGKQFSGARHDC